MPHNRGPARKQCGKPECKKAFNRERMRAFNTTHPGYYTQFGTAAHYKHVCPWCGKTFKNHKDKPSHCSVECWSATCAERQRQRLLPVLHDHPAPRCLLPDRHPVMLLQQREVKRLFVAGTCARCGASFVAHAESGNARYCSTACASLACKARRRARKRLVRCEPYRRIDIFERDGWRCHICGKKIKRGLPNSHPLGATLDHLIPLADGGADAPDNVAAAHRLCNSLKGVTGAAQLLLAV